MEWSLRKNKNRAGNGLFPAPQISFILNRSVSNSIQQFGWGKRHHFAQGKITYISRDDIISEFKIKLSVRTSMADYKKEDWLLTLPLWAIGEILSADFWIIELPKE